MRSCARSTELVEERAADLKPDDDHLVAEPSLSLGQIEGDAFLPTKAVRRKHVGYDHGQRPKPRSITHGVLMMMVSSMAR